MRNPDTTNARHFTLALLLVTLGGCATSSPELRSGTTDRAAQKPRVVVTTDPELDDSNSLIRYLLFSTDFRTEGLIYASSGFHWKGDGTGKTWFVPNREYSRFGLDLCPCESWRWAPDERFIDDAVETYEQVYPNLRVHDPRYPAPAELKSKIRWGNVEFDGDISKDTPGSNLIKALLLDDEPGPIYLLAWGGQSTIARALKSIQEQFESTPEWPTVRRRVSQKALLSTFGDQDDTYARYIQPNWPDIRVLPAGRNGAALGYGASAAASAENAVYYSASWTRENISNRGPLGALYRVWGDGKQMVKDDIFDYFGFADRTTEQLRAMGYVVWLPPRPKGEFISEGDTFTFLNLIDNGLLGYQDDTPGGWASDGQDRSSAPPSAVPNFTRAAQNAFAARMRWSVTPTYAGANHEPSVTIHGSPRISARPGETIRLQGVVSDPDGDAVAVQWWHWKEVGTYPRSVTIANPDSLASSAQIPSDATAGQTIHLILEATDGGTPALTRYQRVVISVTH